MATVENQQELSRESRDKLVQAAAEELHSVLGQDSRKVKRARQALLTIGALMQPEYVEVDGPDFLAYISSQYSDGTHGEPLPFAVTSLRDWRHLTTTAFTAFEPKRGWDPSDEEFARAILDDDQRVIYYEG